MVNTAPWTYYKHTETSFNIIKRIKSTMLCILIPRATNYFRVKVSTRGN